MQLESKQPAIFRGDGCTRAELFTTTGTPQHLDPATPQAPTRIIDGVSELRRPHQRLTKIVVIIRCLPLRDHHTEAPLLFWRERRGKARDEDKRCCRVVLTQLSRCEGASSDDYGRPSERHLERDRNTLDLDDSICSRVADLRLTEDENPRAKGRQSVQDPALVDLVLANGSLSRRGRGYCSVIRFHI